MRVVGVDPGYERLGVAVLEKGGGGTRENVLHASCIRTRASLPFPDRLKTLGDEFARTLDAWSPDCLAIERLFFTANRTTAMAVAETRGTLIYLARSRGLAVREFTPLEIKAAVTGYGKADKQQVASMVKLLVRLEARPFLDDELDAVAAALACLHEGHRTLP